MNCPTLDSPETPYEPVGCCRRSRWCPDVLFALVNSNAVGYLSDNVLPSSSEGPESYTIPLVASAFNRSLERLCFLVHNKLDV